MITLFFMIMFHLIGAFIYLLFLPFKICLKVAFLPLKVIFDMFD